MKKKVQSSTDKFTQARRFNKVWRSFAAVLAAVVIFGTVSALVLPAVTQQTADLSSIALPGDIDAVSGDGIKFRLFDYSKYINLSQPDVDGTYANRPFRPISNYFNFSGAPGALVQGKIDLWYVNQEKYIQGAAWDVDQFTKDHSTVESLLGADGYPILKIDEDVLGNPKVPFLNLTEEQLSLAYLFGGVNDFAVTEYPVSNTILQKDGTRYFYNSAVNAVDYDKDAQKFHVRGYAERGTNSATSAENLSDFLPFNYSNGEVKYPSGTTISGVPDKKDYAIARDAHFHENEVEYWFGMTMEVNFFQAAGGTLDGDEMIFEFSGDDDVWVFIDDVLVLDLGGTHGVASGSINFATGEVKQYLNHAGHTENETVANGYSDPRSFPTTIYECYQKAGAIPSGGWTETVDQNGQETYTFSDYSTHTLKFFYMERGGAQSNCSIDFVLPTIPDSSLTVSKELTTDSGATDAFIDGTTEYQFRVVKVDEYGEASDELFIPAGTEYDLLYDGKAVGKGKVGEGGIFKLRSKESAQFTNMLLYGGGSTAYMVQEIIPDGYLGQYTGVDYVIDGVVGSLSTQAALSQVYSAYSDVLVNSSPVLLSNTTGTAGNSMARETAKSLVTAMGTGHILSPYNVTIKKATTDADLSCAINIMFNGGNRAGHDNGQLYNDKQVLTFTSFSNAAIEYYCEQQLNGWTDLACWTLQPTDSGYWIQSVTVKDGSGYAGDERNPGTIEITIAGEGAVTTPVTGVKLNKNSAEMFVNDRLELIATVEPGDASNKNIIWATSAPGVATVANGVVTAHTAGTVTITATTEDGDFTATCDVSVSTVAVTGVTLDKTEISLPEGSTATLNATVLPENATNKAVTWSSDKPGVATVNNGVVTAVAPGTATITVTTADGGKTAACTVTVTERTSGNSMSKETAASNNIYDTLYVYDVKLDNKTGSNIIDKLTFTFKSATATGLSDIYGDKQLLTFSSFDDSVEYYTDVDLANHFTNKSNWWSNADTLGYDFRVTSATTGSQNEGTLNGKTVKSGGKIIIEITRSSSSVPVTGVTLDPVDQIMQGEKAQLKWTVNPSNATYQNVTFTSSDPTVATVDANGMVTALKNGTTTITVTTKDGGHTYSITLKVGTVALDQVSLPNVKVSLGKTQTLVPVLDPINASVKSMEWTSSNTSVATINATTGELTALKLGTTTITLHITGYDADGNETTATVTCEVEVTPVQVEGVSLNKTKHSFAPGDTLQLIATVTPENAANKNLLWETANENIAKVDENGLVTAVGVGTTTITVKTEDGGYTATCTVTVKGIYTWDVHMVYTGGASGPITITNPGISAWGHEYLNQSLTFQDTESLTAFKELKVLDTYSWLVDESKEWCVWTESNSQYTYRYIVTSPLISNQYLKHGVVYVIVDGGNGMSVDAQLILLNRTEVNLRTDRTIQLTATLIPTPTSVGQMYWDSSDPDIVDVTQDGKITGVSAGEATITVTYGSLQATCKVTVYQGTDTISGWIGSTPGISVGDSHLVVFRNKVDTSKLSELVVEKLKAEDAFFDDEANKEFTITVLLGGRQLPVGTKFYRNNAEAAEIIGEDGLIKLKFSDSVRIPGILAGTTFDIRELIDGKFTPSYQVSSSTGKSDVTSDGSGTYGTFDLADLITTTVTNDSISTKVEISITKQAINNASGHTFEFLVEQVNGSLANGWTPTGTQMPGTQIAVTNDQLTSGTITISFKGQPSAVQYYKISEKNTGGMFDYDDTYYIVGIDASDETPEIVYVYKNGTVSQPITNALAFVNYRTVDLVITKEVLSTKTTDTFDFTLTFDSADALANVTSTANYTVSENTVTFSLGHGKDVTIPGIRYGAKVTVTEANNPNFIAKYRFDNATVYIDGNTTSEITLDKDSTAVHYQNSLAVKMPSTGGIGATPYILLGLGIVLVSIVCGYVLWRKRERRFDA